MTALPTAYAWLKNEPGPRLLLEALKLYGVREREGKVSNPVILGWAEDMGMASHYTHDAIPWCGLFMAVLAKRAGWGRDIPRTPLWARSWITFGCKTEVPALGDVLVFARERGGHVGLYVGEDSSAFHVLGGNQGDAVSIARIARSRLLAARRPRWRVAEPDNVRPVRLDARGILSHHEA